MIVSELLDELRNNVLRDNSALVAGDDDKLWSDETLIRYIDDAYRRFARESLLIRDNTTPAVTQVSVAVGVNFYQLHTSVLAVLSARYDQDGADLVRLGHGILDTNVPVDQLYFDTSTLATLAPGAPRGYSTDEALTGGPQQKITLRIYPTPSQTEDGKLIRLRVARQPLVRLSIDRLDDELELPEDYQLDMLDWAAYRAYANHDVDGGDSKAAEEHRTKFEAMIQTVKTETRRKIFTPQGFRFGGGALSYER